MSTINKSFGVDENTTLNDLLGPELSTTLTYDHFKLARDTSPLPLDPEDLAELDIAGPLAWRERGQTLEVIGVSANTSKQAATANRRVGQRLRFLKIKGDQVLVDRTERASRNWDGLCDATHEVGVTGVTKMKQAEDTKAEENRLLNEAHIAREEGRKQDEREYYFRLYYEGYIPWEEVRLVLRPGDGQRYRDWKAKVEGDPATKAEPKAERAERKTSRQRFVD